MQVGLAQPGGCAAPACGLTRGKAGKRMVSPLGGSRPARQ